MIPQMVKDWTIEHAIDVLNLAAAWHLYRITENYFLNETLKKQ